MQMAKVDKPAKTENRQEINVRELTSALTNIDYDHQKQSQTFNITTYIHTEAAKSDVQLVKKKLPNENRPVNYPALLPQKQPGYKYQAALISQ